jgi:hypothetical protein
VLNAVSRRNHGGAGAFDVDLPMSGTPGIECRTGGATSDYQVVVTFAGAVTVNGTPQAQVTSGIGDIGTGGVSNGGIVTVSGSTVTIPLTNLANAQTIEVTLFGVTVGGASGNVVVPMSILIGDINGNGSVNATDVAETKSQSGRLLTATNFRSDVNATGNIDASDIAIVKSHVGTARP